MAGMSVGAYPFQVCGVERSRRGVRAESPEVASGRRYHRPNTSAPRAEAGLPRFPNDIRPAAPPPPVSPSTVSVSDRSRVRRRSPFRPSRSPRRRNLRTVQGLRRTPAVVLGRDASMRRALSVCGRHRSGRGPRLGLGVVPGGGSSRHVGHHARHRGALPVGPHVEHAAERFRA
jgi:hypothetical protein